MNQLKKIVLATIVAAAGIATSAQAGTVTGHPASLLGDTITMSMGSSSAQEIIDAETEFAVPATVLTSKQVCIFRTCWNYPVFQANDHGLVFDFGANTLTITTPNGLSSWGDLGPITFSGFDAILTKVSLASIQGFGLDFITDVKFNEHSISFDLDGGFSAGAGAKLVYNITAVPEPTTVALLGLGLVGFAASRRKSAKTKNA